MNHRSYAKLVRSVLFSVLVIAPLGIISPTLFAADQNTDEIIITVRKTEENAQEPVAAK